MVIFEAKAAASSTDAFVQHPDVAQPFDKLCKSVATPNNLQIAGIA